MPPPGHRPFTVGNPRNGPPTDHRPNIHIRRPSQIINNINTPQPDIFYPIVNEKPLQPPTPLQPPPETEDRNLRRINREARMKAHNERRNNKTTNQKTN